MGAKDSKPRSLEEQKILIHGLSKVFGAFMRGVRRSTGLEDFPDVLKLMLKTCYKQNHDEFHFAVLPHIHKLIDEMEKSERLEISTEDRKSKKQCVIKIKFNYSDEFYSNDLSPPSSLKRENETPSDPTLKLSETARKVMTDNYFVWENVEKILEERINTDLEKIDEYDSNSVTLKQGALEPVSSIPTLDRDLTELRLTELEKVKTRFPLNKIFGSKRYGGVKTNGNSVFYDQELFLLDPNYGTTETLLPGTNSDSDGVDGQSQAFDLEELIVEPGTISADLDFFEVQLQNLQRPSCSNNTGESLADSLVSTEINGNFFIPEEEEEEQFLKAVKKQKDDLEMLLRDTHDSSTKDLAQESQIPVANLETMPSFERGEAGSSGIDLKNLGAENPLSTQSTSSPMDYGDKFASLERISQEELAKKLAEQERFYGDKMDMLRKKRKERNEDAQEEIRAIKESQKERLRLVYHK